MLGKKLIKAAAGAAGAAEGAYIEDVFSTWLYTGTGSAQTITNGIDLAGEGGLVWIKSRSNAYDHRLTDTERGLGLALETNTSDAQASTNHCVNGSFNSDGFSLNNTGSPSAVNTTGDNLVSWTFRKAPKFFDVVTWTGTGVSGRTVAHNLGSVPGSVIIKRTDSTSNWTVWHRSLTTNNFLRLNLTNAEVSAAFFEAVSGEGNVPPTDSVITLGDSSQVNANGGTYVAYLFAHNAGGFGDDGEQNVITCGSYTGNDGTQDINVGFEPQWVLIKNIDNTSNWALFDNMRSFIVDSSADSLSLRPNTTAAEGSATNARIGPRPNGFGFINESGGDVNGVYTYIYIAIRRGPMKTPESGTEVFAPVTRTATDPDYISGFPVDMGWVRKRDATSGSDADTQVITRLLGENVLTTNTTDAEAGGGGNGTALDYNNGMIRSANSADTARMSWMFRRAPGFFDVVAYTGTGSANQSIPHNLTVAPQLIIVKGRSNVDRWGVYASSLGYTQKLSLNENANAQTVGYWADTADASNFYVTSDASTGASGVTYVAYLFATVAGVSKVGSYTGTGTTLAIDCGFSAGARFVLIKRTDSYPTATGDWYVWDSARGISASSDPYILLNSTAAEVTGTDYIDPSSAGFEISSSAPAAINASGGSFVFLAVA